MMLPVITVRKGVQAVKGIENKDVSKNHAENNKAIKSQPIENLKKMELQTLFCKDLKV